MNICPKSVFNNRRKFILYTQDVDIMPIGWFMHKIEKYTFDNVEYKYYRKR